MHQIEKINTARLPFLFSILYIMPVNEPADVQLNITLDVSAGVVNIDIPVAGQ